LVAEDPRLWLSRSWTTRPPRPGEPTDAYLFVDRDAFEQRVREGGFLEWAEFLGHLYGTPLADPPAGQDVLLEIDLQGAEQIRALRPDARLILLIPPSAEVQAERMRARGDDEVRITERVRAGRHEERRGLELADAVVVNAEVSQAAAEVADIMERCRRGDFPGSPSVGGI
jgi:guanylate kinase